MGFCPKSAYGNHSNCGRMAPYWVYLLIIQDYPAFCKPFCPTESLIFYKVSPYFSSQCPPGPIFAKKCADARLPLLRSLRSKPSCAAILRAFIKHQAPSRPNPRLGAYFWL